MVAGLAAGLALSPKLWLSARLYPLTPVGRLFPPLPAPWDAVVFGALIAALLAFALAPRGWIAMVLFALIAFLALEDQSRWQPWFYQYVLMLLAIALGGSRRPDAALDTCRLIVAATYFWSGIAKFNPGFASDVLPALAPWAVHHLALVPPALECALAIGLLTRRFRRPAVLGAIGMHVWILVAIGPLGTRFNAVVWPWNVAMIAFLLILFRAPDPGPRAILRGRGFAFQRVALLLVGLMPALSLFQLWDHYLSAALYSGNRGTGTVYFSDDVFERLPETLQDEVTDEGVNRGGLDIAEWSWIELNVPPYPEPRIFRHVARAICGYAGPGSYVELVVVEPYALVHSRRRTSYGCPQLR